MYNQNELNYFETIYDWRGKLSCQSRKEAVKFEQ